MDFLLATVLCLEIFVGYNAQVAGNYNYVCREGEEYHMCKSPCEPTCDSIRRGIQNNCSRSCVAGCFCRSGLVRANDSTCVPPEECTRPVCKENEEYLECGSPCELNCTNMNTGIFCTKPCQKGCFCKPDFVRDLKGKCVYPRNCLVAGNFQCPVNEMYVNCMNFCSSCFRSEYCVTPYCVPGCDCKPGYYRNFYKQCVTYEQCLSEQYDLQQQCGENEVYTTCVNPCNDCVSRGRCEYFDDYCTAGCDCKQGFFRSENGICIREENCYRRCKENEVYRDCGPACPRTCANYRRLFYHTCKKECVSGCFCRDNFVLGPDGKCIPPEYCFPERQPECPPGERYYDCIPTCRVTCDTYNDVNVLCDTTCAKGCFCNDGQVRRRDGVCVLPKDCPAKRLPCPQGEVLYQCLPTCRTTCRTLNSSSEICSTECKPGCFCQPGLVHNDDGNCVRPSECSLPVRPTCPPGEVYYDCVPTCQDSCENLASSRPCTKICLPGCFCRKGFVRRRDGVCIRPRNCPTMCGPNEEFLSCGSACPFTCENFQQRQVCTDQCVRGCFCKVGFILGPGRRCILPRDCPDRVIHPCCIGRRAGTGEHDSGNETISTLVPSTATTLTVANEPKTNSISLPVTTTTVPATTDSKVPDTTTTSKSASENTTPQPVENTTTEAPSQTSAENKTELTSPATTAAETSSTNTKDAEITTTAVITTVQSQNATLVNSTAEP